MTTAHNQMTPVWQYLLDDIWINCSTENSELLSNRQKNPTLEPIVLQNDQGILD